MTESSNSNGNNPLWLPRGSVRSVLALLLVAAAVIDLWIGLGERSWLTDAVLVILGFYFGSKSTQAQN